MDSPHVDVVMPVCGSITLISAIIVGVSYSKYPEVQKYIFIRAIVYEILCCGASATAFLLGPSLSTGTFGCWYQGLVQFYFTTASVLWVLVITRLLQKIIVYRNVKLELHRYYHYMCWGVPLLTTFLPLITNTYGHYSHWAVCTITRRADSPESSVAVWEIVSQFGIVWVVIGLTVAMFAQMILHLAKMRQRSERRRTLVIRSSTRRASAALTPASSALNTDLTRIFYTMGVHALILLCCWILITCHVLWDLFEIGEFTEVLKPTGMSLVLLQGFLSAVALILTSAELRTCIFIELGLLPEGTPIGVKLKNARGLTTAEHNANSSTDGDVGEGGGRGKERESDANSELAGAISLHTIGLSKGGDGRFSSYQRPSDLAEDNARAERGSTVFGTRGTRNGDRDTFEDVEEGGYGGGGYRDRPSGASEGGYTSEDQYPRGESSVSRECSMFSSPPGEGFEHNPVHKKG